MFPNRGTTQQGAGIISDSKDIRTRLNGASDLVTSGSTSESAFVCLDWNQVVDMIVEDTIFCTSLPKEQRKGGSQGFRGDLRSRL